MNDDDINDWKRISRTFTSAADELGRVAEQAAQLQTASERLTDTTSSLTDAARAQQASAQSLEVAAQTLQGAIGNLTAGTRQLSELGGNLERRLGELEAAHTRLVEQLSGHESAVDERFTEAVEVTRTTGSQHRQQLESALNQRADQTDRTAAHARLAAWIAVGLSAIAAAAGVISLIGV